MKKDTLQYLCAISILALWSSFVNARSDQDIYDTYVEYDSGWVSSTPDPEPSPSTYYDYSNRVDPAEEKRKRVEAEKQRAKERAEEERRRAEEERRLEAERRRREEEARELRRREEELRR